jgi:N-acetylmuramoyl-L-alanine amidase
MEVNITMALQRIWMPSPSYHGRNLSGVRLIVLHTAEGATTIESLGGFFSNPANQVSSHVGADDKLGKIGEYVTRGNAAWTQANYNNVAVALELCGFASWSTSTWKNQHHNMLRNCADWIREESQKLGIPITRLTDSQAQGNGRGVCQHINLGAGGGGHVDCGPGFPMDYVLDLARGGAPSEPETEEEMAGVCQITNPNNGNLEVWEVNKGGDLYSRTWRPNSNAWDDPQKRGGGYYGVPVASIDSEGNVRITALATNKCVVWTLLKAGGGWSSANV